MNIWAQGGCEWGVEEASQLGTSYFYRSPNIVRVIKSRRLKCAGPITRMEEGRSAFTILTGKPAWPINKSNLINQFKQEFIKFCIKIDLENIQQQNT